MFSYLSKYFLKATPILNSYSEIFFLRGTLTGLAILLISCLNIHIGLSGLLAITSAYVFARYIGYRDGFLQSGFYTYNALLVGFAIGALFELSFISIPFIAIAAVLTFILTLVLANIFYRLFSLQVLSIPFVIVSSLIYLASSRYSNLYVHDLYNAEPFAVISFDWLPLWLAGFYKSLGAILFMPSVLVGFLLSLIILRVSRILLILAVLGFLLGTALQGFFTGSYVLAINDIAAFNYILIAMALGAVFNIPSPKSYILAFIGVTLATVLVSSTDVFWSQYNIPAFTMPFTMITLGMVYVLSLLEAPLRPTIFKPTPEETAEYYHTAKLRYPHAVTMHLPFQGQWTVWQGFDGKWTHKGLWKYAYDFIQQDEGNSSFKNDGKSLSDYYCFQQNVCSPVQGYVVYVADQFVDNPIGVVDNTNNWGNTVIIQDVRGYYVALCHLSQFQVFVKAGDWVEAYQVVGLCGNSGYSPQPHIHMQYQTTSYLTSATMPFCFTGMLEHLTEQANTSKAQFIPHGLPEENSTIAPAYCHPFYLQIGNFVLDEVLSFQVRYKEQDIEKIQLVVKMAVDGTFYLSRNTSRLYLGKTDSTFYFYHLDGNDPYLKLLYQALPSLPFNYLAEYQWHDYIPVSFISSIKYRMMTQLKQVITGQGASHNASYHFVSDTIVSGEIQKANTTDIIKTKIVLDPYVKFNEIIVDEYQLVAIDS